MTTVKKSNEEKTFNKVVNIDENGEITLLSYIFKHSDGFMGATGSKFEPVTREQYEENTTEDAICEYLIDSGVDLPEQWKRTGFEGWAKAIIDAGEEGAVMYDNSYRELWDYLREACNLDKESAYIFNCVGGGRCFDKKFKGNVNPELSKIIRQYESGKGGNINELVNA